MQKVLHSFLERSHKHNSNIIYAQMYQNSFLEAEYRRFPVKTRLNLWSVSKSFVSIGAGIAMDEGIITLHELIYPYFESFFPKNACENLYKIRIIDLLTMSSGLETPLFFCDDSPRYYVKDWIKYFFHNGAFVHEPGSHFLYSNFNTYILSCIIEKKSGQNLLEYLRYRLFEPIGIGNPDWTLCPMGHCMAANGLYVTIDELSNFCHLVLNKGAYQGKRIVSSNYVEDACKKHIDSYNPMAERADYQNYGYGYFIYMAPIPGAIIFSGNYGQYCLICPEKQAVFCVMSLDGNDHKKIRDDLIDSVNEYYISL